MKWCVRSGRVSSNAEYQIFAQNLTKLADISKIVFWFRDSLKQLHIQKYELSCFMPDPWVRQSGYLGIQQ